MLCETETDEEDLVTGVGPGSAGVRCATGCCGRTATLQIRTRYSYGAAKMCAAYVDFATSPDVYWTTLITTNTIRSYQTVPGADTLIRTCIVTTTVNSGDAAIKVQTDPLIPMDCNEDDTVVTEEPEDCGEVTLDPPADYFTEEFDNEYAGESAQEQDVKDAALAALTPGEWSEWADLVIVNMSGGEGYLTLSLASSTAGHISAPSPIEASVGQVESELRVIGGFPVSVAISQGAGAPGELPVTHTTINPGASAVAFSTGPPSFADDWEAENIFLRCVCPAHLAPV